MNILHHKSWHVRNKNNIQRVRRDEQKARDEENERQKRILLAESESRVTLLRHRLKPDDNLANNVDNADTTVGETSGGSHLDVFDDFGDKIQTKNIEHEKEVKDEKEKFETKTGILQYLVDKESDVANVWYLDSHEKRMRLSAEDVDTIDTEKQLKDQKQKTLNDPIEDMKKYLNAMKRKSDDKSSSKAAKSGHQSSKVLAKRSESYAKIKSKKSKKKHKKHKKKKRRRDSSDSSDDSRGDDSVTTKNVSKGLEQLRAERLEREKVERERTQALLYGKPNTDTVVMDDRRRTYNSQFNPEIARQNADK